MSPFFLRKNLAYYMNKSIAIEKKNSVFSGPRVLLFCPKSIPWTGSELAGDSIENCENSQLTFTNPSRLL